MAINGNGLPTWKKFDAFRVFGDYAPMQGFCVLIRVGIDPDLLMMLLERRATSQELLDPALAQANLRSGLGLLRTGLVSFAYATVEEVIVMLHPHVVQGQGDPVKVHDRLISDYTSSLSLLLGHSVTASSAIFELPDTAVARRGLVKLAEDVEEATPRRSALWLGAQLRGRGQQFHPSMVETLEEQSTLLQSNGIDMDALPAWWWRGAAALSNDGALQVYDDLPGGEELGNLLAG